MRRVVAILFVAAAVCLTVVGAALVAGKPLAPGLIAAGRAAYGYRSLLDVHPAGARTVVWLGDSTVMTPPPYPDLVSQQILDPAGIRSEVRAWYGVGFQDYYCVLDGIAASRPAVLVLVANLRNVLPSGGPFGDLCSGLPLTELAHGPSLPWHATGLSIPRLVVLQVLRWSPVEAATYWLAGLRALVNPATWPARIGASSVLTLEQAAQAWESRVRDIQAAYDAPVAARRPMLAFADATVRAAVARGIRVVVVVSPAPIEALRARGWYREAAWRHRIGVLAQTVEGAGGRLVDLHDLVPDADFSDAMGHLAKSGAALVAERLGPTIRDEAIYGGRAPAR